MIGIKEKAFDFNGAKIAYTDTGPEDGRVLFCAHGLLSNGRDYDFLALALATHGYRTIAIDLPGRGNSDPLADPNLYSPPYYAPFCLALIHHITGGASFDWLGVSLGGMIGMGVAHVEGVNMERLILVDVGAEIPGSALDMVTQLARAPSAFASKDAAIKVFKQRCAAWGINDEKIWDHLIVHNITDEGDGLFSFHYDPDIALPMSDANDDLVFWGIWEGITQPTLLIRGGKSVLLPEEIAQKMQSTYKGEKFDEVVFADCGHVPNLMQDDHIVAIVDWLK